MIYICKRTKWTICFFLYAVGESILLKYYKRAVISKILVENKQSVILMIEVTLVEKIMKCNVIQYILKI
jgi:hypothetical protein